MASEQRGRLKPRIEAVEPEGPAPTGQSGWKPETHQADVKLDTTVDHRTDAAASLHGTLREVD